MQNPLEVPNAALWARTMEKLKPQQQIEERRGGENDHYRQDC
jgi:hypothetical protein